MANHSILILLRFKVLWSGMNCSASTKGSII